MDFEIRTNNVLVIETLSPVGEGSAALRGSGTLRVISNQVFSNDFGPPIHEIGYHLERLKVLRILGMNF
jgi:hypothetical protein